MKTLRALGISPAKNTITIPKHEYDMLTFKSEAYDRIDSKLNEGLMYIHGLAEFATNYHEGMQATMLDIFKELRKDELRKRTGGGKLFPVQTGDSDLPW